MRMVEKVATAIHDVIWPAQEWDGDETACRAIAEAAAISALQAMRDPDEEMIDAAERVGGHSLYRYQAMIDKAIQESGE